MSEWRIEYLEVVQENDRMFWWRPEDYGIDYNELPYEELEPQQILQRLRFSRHMRQRIQRAQRLQRLLAPRPR